jgi:phage tail-like protein
MDRREPLINARFRVEIEGLQDTGAVEVIFPEARIIEGGGKARVIQYGPLTLRRGMTTSSDWYHWWDKARASVSAPRAPQGARAPRGAKPHEGPGAAKKTVTVVLMDRSDTDINRWTFSRALPSGYFVSQLNALGSEPLIETLELSVDEFRLAFGDSSGQSKVRRQS